MSEPSGALIQVFSISATNRYLWVAGYAWMLYDWLITLGQEINLVWLQSSGGRQSKLLYGFTRYYSLAIATGSVAVFMQSNLSADFCRVFFYLRGVTGLAQMSAVQGVLLLRVHVMYSRSFKIVTIGTTLFVIQLVTMSIIFFIDTRDYVLISPPAPATGCWALSQHPALAKAFWSINLVFETGLCSLALGSAYAHWRDAGTKPPNILTILIRDSLFWYVLLAVFLFLNALAMMTETGILALVGMPAIQAIATICTPRFLLNLRTAYFSPKRNASATRASRTCHAETEGTTGTVGAFRPAMSDLADEGGGGGRDEAGSIEMGIWNNNGPES